MGVNLTLYLMRKHTRRDQVVLENKTRSRDYEQVPLLPNMAFDLPALCFVKRTEPREAPWKEWLGTVYNFKELHAVNQSSGCVLVMETDGRVFALAFGTGRHAIDPERIEYDFGLRVAMQKVHPENLRHLVSKTVDVRTREKSTYHHAGGKVGDFAMDLDTEWLRSIAGAAQPGEDFSAVAGTDAVRLTNYRGDMNSLAVLCRTMLQAYEHDTPEIFAFVEHVRPIPTKDPRHEQLETQLSERVVSGNRDGIEVIVDWASARQAESSRLRLGRATEALDDLSSASVWAALDKVLAGSANVKLSKTKIEIQDESGEIAQTLRLFDVLHAEHEENGETYLRLERRWFVVADDYIKQIDSRVQVLPLANFTLPDWDKGKHPREEHYNQWVANQRRWLLQDQKCLYPGGGARVEPCDLLTENAEFIHVKEGRTSACLNHLFGQLSASAELYARHSPSRTKMQRRYATRWTATPLADRQPTFVAAIARNDVKKDLLGRMLVAKINLLDHARRVNALGFDFAIAGFKVKQAQEEAQEEEVCKEEASEKRWPHAAAKLEPELR